MSNVQQNSLFKLILLLLLLLIIFLFLLKLF